MTRILPVLGAMLLLAACATQDGALRDAQALIDAGRYEEGLALLSDISIRSPDQPRVRATVVLQQERVVASLLAMADRARLAGDYPAAAQSYQRVLGLSPRSSRALDALKALEQQRNVAEMQKQARAAFRRGDLELAEKQLAAVLAIDPFLVDAIKLRQETEAHHARTASPYPRLRSRITRPVTLDFREANLKMILDALSRTTGINFIVDKDVRPDLRATIFVKQVSVEDALELLLAQSQLEKKVVNENTVLVYPATPAKIREYQDWVIRTFFISNMDVKQAQLLIKTMLKSKDVFIDEKLNTLTLRDSPDAVRLAEKLLHAQDQPDSEVVLEVELLDVSRDRFLDLGVQWPSTFTLLAPDGGAATLLSHLRGDMGPERIAIDRSVQARARSVDNDVNTLATPRIRVRNREKARIHIGDRIPIVSATSIPSTQGPVITETVQYLDTGIKLEVQPTIYQGEEVAINVTLEVSDSQDAGRTNSGTTLVRVKTSNAQTSLRLKNGETQILAGLIRNDHAANADQVPGLGAVPGVGRLFGRHDDNWKKRELVLSITPRIVRTTPYLAPHQLEYSSGTEATLRARPLSLQQGSEEAVTLTAPPGVAPAGASAAPSTPATPASTPPATPTTAAAVGAPGSSAVAGPADAANPAAGRASASRRGQAPATPVAAVAPTASLAIEGPPKLRIGEEATITLMLRADQPLVSTGLQLAYDPKALKVLEVTEGPLMRSGGVATSFLARNDESAGRISVGVTRQGGQGTAGEGPLLQLRVQGLAAAASAPLKVEVFSAIGPGDTLAPTGLPNAFELSVTEP